MSQRRTRRRVVPPVQNISPPSSGPLPGASATVPNQNVPKNKQHKWGWYPRWWLLSAMFCAALVSAIWLLQRVVCDVRHSNALICHTNDWNQWWQQALLVLALWFIFALGWLGAYCFGIGTVEVNDNKRGPFATVVKTLSEYKPMRNLLYIYALILVMSLTILWFLKYPLQPVGFAFACIIIFVANCCFFTEQEPASRLVWLRGYGVTMLVTIPMMFLFSDFQPLLFIVELIIFSVGVASFFLRSPDGQVLTPEQEMEQTISPVTAFMDLIRGLIEFFGRFNARRQGNANNQGTPTT